MKKMVFILGILILGIIAIFFGTTSHDKNRHSDINAKKVILDISAEKINLNALALIRLGYHTERIGMEDYRCGLLQEGFRLGQKDPTSPNESSEPHIGRWFFTLGIKPTTIILSGSMVEIQCDVNKAPSVANESDVYVFFVPRSIPKDSHIEITKK